MERLKSQILMKRNIKFLIRHRGKTQVGLAKHLRRGSVSDKDANSWLSHCLDESNDRKKLPLEYWDRAADYLGVNTYHFFQPGLGRNPDTERRKGGDRRKWVERRLGQDIPARSEDADLMGLIRLLPIGDVEELTSDAMKRLDVALRRRPATPRSSAGQG